MDNRRFKRYFLDVPIEVQGIDLKGNTFTDETITLNISGSGAYFVTSYEYDPKQVVTVTIHLATPLGDNIKAGEYTMKAKITRMAHEVRDASGHLKKQEIAICFDGILGYTKVSDPWSENMERWNLR